MAPPTAFEKAEADRKSLTDQLELLDLELTASSTLERRQMERYMEESELAGEQVLDNHKTLRKAAPTELDMTAYVAEFRRLSKMASRIHSGFYGILSALPPLTTPSTSTPAAGSTGVKQQKIKFPPVEMPKFSGNMLEWMSFRDMFVTAVHNSTLTNVEKLTQLKTLLEGEAARQVRSLVLSDSNYSIAWNQLKQRYENNRELLFAILRRLLNQPVITSSSAQGIRSLLDTTNECVRSLEVLAIPTDQWDAILLYILFSKMDPTSRELWEQSLPDTSIPPLTKMSEFLEQRARALAASSVPAQRNYQKPQQVVVRAHHASTSNCKVGCSHAHPLFKCPTFRGQSIQQRSDTVKRFNLCLNCLGEGHISSSCSSTRTCKTCNRKHHTMLHLEGGRQQSSNQSSGNQNQQTPSVSTHHAKPVGELQTGILATAQVIIVNENAKHLVRALVDPGSTNSYITEETAKQIHLHLRPCNIPMMGLAATSIGSAKYVTSFHFTSHFKSMLNLSATALVVKKISTSIPSERLKKESWPHLKDLELADPEFHRPMECDILLGTDVFWSLLENEKIGGGDHQPYAVKSSLGWLVAGANKESSSIITFNTTADVNFQLQRFWEQENMEGVEDKMSSEEEQCEQHFKTTYNRDKDGRFIVSLPFKAKPKEELGSSRQAAVKRFLSMERKFNSSIKNPEMLRKLSNQWSSYKEFMLEYENLGHMSLVPVEEITSEKPTYYIPHHSVLKESSTTTKLRVVFDASAPSSSGTSLNQCMMVGPTLQDTIADIMLRFRTHPIAFTADIVKMYRQIRINPEETDLQRIVWREHPSLPLRDYRLLTGTYGTTSTPYLAIKCLRQLAKEEQTRYPAAAKIALRDFYVDDTTSGCASIEDAKETVHQLISLCMSGGFPLRKWTSNSAELLESIPEDLRETKNLVELREDSTIKTLGVFWNPKEDKYLFKITIPPDMPGMYTKRIILSEIARIYDPLGWLAPAIIVCKIFMQELWKTSLNWDDKLPAQLQERWLQIRCSLKDLETIEIPRCVILFSTTYLTLIGCSDASIKAISASIYIVCESENQDTTCHLLTSKTRVAPVKHVTLPRLELNGAVLLSELLSSTIKALQLPFHSIRAYVDSTITLHCINSNPTRWKTYVKRRVQTIQENVPAANWYHIPGEENPADCASRGITANELQQHQLWWNGSQHFFRQCQTGIELLEGEITQVEAESQAIKIHHAQPTPLPALFTSYSSFLKLTRIIAYMLRFIIMSRRCPAPGSGSLSVHELQNSHHLILQILQQSQYPVEYSILMKGGQLPSSNSLIKLQPFIAQDGLIRVGGRLRNANIPFDRKHPILLPKGNAVSSAIINDMHLSLLHAGPTATLSSLQQKYWIINGRDTVRLVLRKCVTCARHQADLLKQIMGDLPSHRVTQARPFSKVGVDYAGPISIRPMVRSKVSLKCWLAIFVCFATHAIHIEVVSSLSTDCFIVALRRFIHRRGKPNDIFSDCGTNFKGADKVLREFLSLSKQTSVQRECSSQSITWHFNPAGAPHFGGLWEAGVKSIKYHLKRVMGSSLLTYEQMLTLVVQIEGILNSRPLVPVSADPNDLDVLTPAHFLIGSAITAPPEPVLVDTKEGYLRRWQLVQHRQQLFWKRWSAEYISRLQQRPKWFTPSANLEVGHLVIIKDERLPPLKWKLGRVIAVHPGADDRVRVATLRTSEGEIKRPITKLSLLPIPLNENLNN